MYDLLLVDEGTAFYALLGSNFVNGTLDVCREMLLDPNTVTGLGDAGAHVNLISDCSASTFHLTHWGRDRTVGERLPLELLVHKLSGANAELYGFADRGTVEVGKRADLNVIDFERLRICPPVLRHDLPTGVSRILQPAEGYLATLVARRGDPSPRRRHRGPLGTPGAGLGRLSVSAPGGRTSGARPTNVSGCSKAAKWPPRSSSFQYRMSVNRVSAQRRDDPHDLLREDRAPGGHVDGAVDSSGSGEALPVEPGRRGAGGRQPVEHHVVEQLVAGEDVLGVAVAVGPRPELLDDPGALAGR